MLIPALSFVVAMIAAVILGWAVRRVAPSVGAVVPPRPDRWHNSPTPTMGGVAIAGATILGFGALSGVMPLPDDWTRWVPVLLAALAMFGVGVFDDRLQLSPVAKLVASLAIGGFLLFALAGFKADNALPSHYTLISVVWFAGVCHAMNLLDNMDGLLAGVALIAGLFFMALLGNALGGPLVVLIASVSGALLGFLYWNRPRARLFMGDCGSLFIGAIFGGASLVPAFHTSIALISPTVLAAIILVVPLFDTAFVLVLRRAAGLSATRGGTDHVSHRLVSLGFSERSAVRILYLLALIGGGTAWASKLEPAPWIIAVFGILVVLLGIYLARVSAYNSEDFVALQKSSFAPFLKDLAFKWHAGQIMLDLVLITVCYYLAYRLRFDGDVFDKFYAYFESSLSIVIACQLAALYQSGLYRRSWETFGLRDLTVAVRGVVFGSVLSVAAAYYLNRNAGFSRVVVLLDGLLLIIAIIGTRVSFRSMALVAATRNKRSRRVVVYGAGSFGQLLVREMRANTDWEMNPVAFIDDDPLKAERWIVGVPVRGALDQLDATIKKHAADEVVISSPAINGVVEIRIREICRALNRPVKRLQMEIR